MARQRTFGANSIPTGDEAPEGCEFTLEGTYLADVMAPANAAKPAAELEVKHAKGSAWAVTFTTVPVAPAGVLDDFVSVATVDRKGNRQWNAPSLLRFLYGVLPEDQVPAFDELVHDKDRIVELDTLGEIVIWLSEELLGRPTTPLSS